MCDTTMMAFRRGSKGANSFSHRAFLATSALLFTVSTAVTIAWCGSMSTMGGMTMPGGWTMSMTWMRMPGQTWAGGAVPFLGMWTVMMVAMMLPSLVPMLWRYRQTIGPTDGHRLAWLTVVVGLGYFTVWAAFGVAAYPLGIALATVTMRVPMLSHAVPTATGAVVLIIGVLQFTAWKTHRLNRCRQAPDLYSLSSDASSAWRHGLRLGLRCAHCCGGLMVLLLVIGVMDLRAMAIVTAAITLERLTPAGAHVAKAIGVVVVGAGLLQIGRAVVGLG